MRKRIALGAAVAALLLGTVAVDAATSYSIRVLSNGYVFSPIVADSPKAALIALWHGMGIIVQPWQVVITVPQVCRSTHKIVGGGVVKYGYDQTQNPNHCA